MQCTICVENYNRSTRKMVICHFAECNYTACMTCVKTYILDKSIQAPHCTSCRKAWSRDFLSEHFPKNFWMTEFRKKREVDLFNSEKTYLPPLQKEAEKIIKLDKIKQDNEELKALLQKNDANEDQLVKDQRRIKNELTEKYDKNVALHRQIYNKVVLLEKTAPVMKCPMNCRGFLDEKYNCGLCLSTVCKDCHQKKDEEHKCNPNEVATITELKKSTKPCPKCQIRIYKTDGCDQMFCISCHTAFSWNTGRVETGIVHNPHYFEALRAGNIVDHRHRVHQGECGALPNIHAIRAFLKGVSAKIQDDIYRKYQRIVHHRSVTMLHILEQPDENVDRLKYLTGKYDEETFKQKLYIKHAKNERIRDEREIMESYLSISEEMFRALSYDNIEQTMKQMESLKDMTHAAICNLDTKHKYTGYLKAQRHLL